MFQSPPEVGQTRETTGDTYMSSSFTPMEGQGTFTSRSPSWEHSIEKDSGNHRRLPGRLGNSQGRQDGVQV